MHEWMLRAGVWLLEPQNIVAIVQMVASIVTAVATYVLWRATKTLAVETTTLSKMTSNPFVIAHIERSAAGAGALSFMAENSGNAVAFDIEILVRPEINRPNVPRDPDKPGSSRYVVGVMPPGKKIPLATLLTFENVDTIFAVEVRWSERPGAEPTAPLLYETKCGDAYLRTWGTPEEKMARSLEKIADNLADRRR